MNIMRDIERELGERGKTRKEWISSKRNVILPRDEYFLESSNG